jgi:type I restriction enzyme S subunit
MMWNLPRAWTWTPLGPHLLERAEAIGSLAPEEAAHFDTLRGVSNREGIIDPPFDRVRPIKNPSRYVVLRIGYFAYNPMRINVGSIGLVRSEAQAGKISPDYVVFTTRRTLLPEYLFAYLKSDVGRQIIRAATAGAVRERLYFRDLARLSIPLPPVLEQRRIVRLLDAAEELRRLRDQADCRTADLIPAIFHEMFGDPAGNPKGWPVIEMRETFEIPPNYGTMIPPASEGAWLDLRVGSIQNGVLALSERKYVDLPPETVARHEVRDGDLLLARAIGSVEQLGKCIIAYPGKEKWAFDSHLMRVRFRPETIHPEMIRSFLTSPGGRRLFLNNTRESAVQFNINTKEFGCIRLPLPPLDLQQAFAARVAEVRALETRQAASRRRLDNLYQSLLHRAFRGEI